MDIQLATRIEEIRHRIQIESRVIVGAKNIVRTLSSSGGKNVNEQMKKTIAEVRGVGLCFSGVGSFFLFFDPEGLISNIRNGNPLLRKK